MSAKIVSKGIMAVGTWNTAKIIASALVSPILARLLGTDGYGQYAYYLALLVLVSPFANLGTVAILNKNIAERPDDPVWRNHLVVLAGLINIPGTVTAGLIVAMTILAYNPPDRQTIAIAGIIVGAIVFEQASLFSRGILYGMHQEQLAMWPTALGTIMSAAIGVGLAASGLGLIGVLAGIFIANLGVAVVTFKRASRFLQLHSPLDLPGVLPISQILQFGLSSSFFVIFSLALSRVDALLIRHLANEVQTGLYAAAVQWSEFVLVVSITVEGVMMQSTAQLWADQRTDEITKILSRLLRYVALGTTFCLIIVFVFASQILNLYFGPDFAGASLALRILIPGVFGLSLSRVMGRVIQARGNVLAMIRVMALVALVNLGLNWVLIPGWGAAGAATASCITYGSVIFAYSRIIRGYGVTPFKGFHPGRLLLLCAITATALMFISMFIPTALVALIVGGFLAVFLYWAGALWLGLINVQEIQQIIDNLPEPLRKHSAGVFQILLPMLLRIELGLVNKL